jgi:PAS domain S-box-containing protein
MTLRGVPRFLFGTLRGRLILAVAAVHAVLMALFVADLTQRQREMLLDRQVEEASALAQALATSAAGWIAADELSGLQELVENQRNYPELQFALLTDARGQVKAATDPRRRGLYVLDGPTEARFTLISKTPALVDVAAPALVSGRHVGWARVGLGQKAAGERLAQVTRDGVIYALAAIAVGSLLAWAMGRAVTRRLYAVQETINAVRAGDHSARSTLRGTDEAAAMAREFNAMLDAVAEQDARIRGSEEKYRSLVQNIQAAVVVHGPDTGIVTCNRRAQELLGLSEEQLTGKAAIDADWHFTRADGTPLPLDEYPVNRVLASSGPVRDLVVRVHRPHGDEVTVLVSADPERDARGALTGVVVTFFDITERQRAEEALRRSEERYRRIVETAHEGIWLIDAESRTTFVNRQMAQMLGCSVEEMQGALLTDFMDEEGQRIARENVERRRQGIAEQHDFKFRRKDGTALWTLIETTPFFDERGGYAGALGMITDVSDRRLIEEQLRQSQKLEAVARLAGGVAHDFNNLLTAMLGAAEVLEADLPPGSPLRGDVADIQAAGHKAAMLTRQLLAFGRKQASEPQRVDLGEIVAAMERMLRRLIGENIELVTARGPGLGAVRADPGQIEQIIVNLVVNGRDAMPGGGRITIETANAEMGLDEAVRAGVAPGPQVMLTVTDTGTGMTPQTLAHLFEPFFTTKGTGRGTGLGLSTVHGIVKQLGGGIQVWSEPGKGSQFRIRLPRLEAPAEPLRADAGVPALARGSETLLVVEDEPIVRSMAVRVLQGAGYTVLDAGDGAEALQLLAAAPGRSIDLLVTDVVMPRLGGPELAAQLRAERPGLKVLFVSGYTERAVDLQSAIGPLTALLAKPFAGPALTHKVRELLDRPAPRAAAATHAG